MVDLRHELMIVANIRDSRSMPVCLGVRDLVPCRGTGIVDGGIWEAREVSGSHQMGMRCRCGVLAMSWGIDGAVAGCGQRFA